MIDRRFVWIFVALIGAAGVLAPRPARFLLFHSDFGHLHLPAGYGWKAAPDGTAGAFYGTDPKNGQTVYVGPDDVFYRFSHAPPIEPRDLRNVWFPTD